MLFNSLHFLLFFVLVTPIYFWLPHVHRWKWLLAASCYFYMVFKPIYIFKLGENKTVKAKRVAGDSLGLFFRRRLRHNYDY